MFITCREKLTITFGINQSQFRVNTTDSVITHQVLQHTADMIYNVIYVM